MNHREPDIMAQNFTWQDLWQLRRWEQHEVIKPQSSTLLFHPISKLCRGCEGIEINFWYCSFLSSEICKTNKESNLSLESQVFKQIDELSSGFQSLGWVWHFLPRLKISISLWLRLKCLEQPFLLSVWDQRHHRALFWASWVRKEWGQGQSH